MTLANDVHIIARPYWVVKKKNGGDWRFDMQKGAGTAKIAIPVLLQVLYYGPVPVPSHRQPSSAKYMGPIWKFS